ncbi:hypothetical protein FACS1894151_09160 [Spirochaetia bacterium]|nr:hypothetical protein FACS1894151_09160 [Spirochaetia bacterium]
MKKAHITAIFRILPSYVIIAIFYLYTMQVNLYADESPVPPEAVPQVTQAELDNFKVTLYTEDDTFPFESFVTLDGKPFDSTLLENKYILVNIWATWCPYCSRERPSLQHFYTQYTNESFTLLTISVGEQAETVKTYIEEHEYQFPVILDTTNMLRKEYAQRIPKTYIIDREGRIIARIDGNKSWDEEQAIKIVRYLIPVLR